MDEQVVGALTDKELAKVLNVTVRTLQNWRRKGLAPASIRVGHSRRTPLESYVRWGVEHGNAERVS